MATTTETIGYTKIVRESEKALLVAIRQAPALTDSEIRLSLFTAEYAAQIEAENSKTMDYWVPRSVINSHDSENKTMVVANWWLRKNGLSI